VRTVTVQISGSVKVRDDVRASEGREAGRVLTAAAVRAHIVRRADFYLYAGYAVSTLVFLVTTGEIAHRLWSMYAVPTYAAAALASLAKTTRPAAPWIAVSGAVALPLVILASARIGQPEVGVLVDGARSILATGSPYLENPTTLADFRPYLPLLFAFGVPGALGLPGILGDPRTWMTVTYVATVAIVIKGSLGRKLKDRELRWIAAFMAMPIVALSATVSAIDLPLTAAFIVAIQQTSRSSFRAAGIATGISMAMKPTAALLATTIGIAILKAERTRAGLTYSVAFAATTTVLLAPVLIADASGLALNVIAFPAGFAEVPSPAQGFFPGVIIGQHLGPVVPIVLTAIAVLIALVLQWFRPSLDFGRLSIRIANTFLAVYLLAPSSRPGYLVLPATLWFTAWAIRKSFNSSCFDARHTVQ